MLLKLFLAVFLIVLSCWALFVIVLEIRYMFKTGRMRYFFFRRLSICLSGILFSVYFLHEKISVLIALFWLYIGTNRKKHFLFVFIWFYESRFKIDETTQDLLMNERVKSLKLFVKMVLIESESFLHTLRLICWMEEPSLESFLQHEPQCFLDL